MLSYSLLFEAHLAIKEKRKTFTKGAEKNSWVETGFFLCVCVLMKTQHVVDKVTRHIHSIVRTLPKPARVVTVPVG